MSDNHSFDIVSKVDYQELSNAVNQALRDIQQRFDLKDSNSEIDLNTKENKLTLHSADEYKVKAVYEILQVKLVKRAISLKALKLGEIESALGGRAKQEITIQQGISKESAKEVTKEITQSKLKVQTQIQGDQVRVIAKKIDDLQAVIKVLQGKNFDIPLQFINFR